MVLVAGIEYKWEWIWVNLFEIIPFCKIQRGRQGVRKTLIHVYVLYMVYMYDIAIALHVCVWCEYIGCIY